jgi:hypothetical protein
MIRMALGAVAVIAVFAYLGGPIPYPGTLDWARVWAAATQAHAAVCR